jgi:ABC-type nitrate/sulfonate/bicarbonate transport system permease component
MLRLFIGYLLAVAVGVAGGIALGLSPVLRRVAAPIVEFLRAIPAPALLPFALLVLGVGNNSKIFVIAFVCLWPILHGVSGVDPTLVDTGRVYRIPASDRLRSVVLPAAAPQIFAGMRTSLSLALILMVISEMVASSNGIGYFVLQSQRSFAIPEMWSGIILLGILGYLFNAVFLLLERRALAWHRGARAGSQ